MQVQYVIFHTPIFSPALSTSAKKHNLSFGAMVVVSAEALVRPTAASSTTHDAKTLNKNMRDRSWNISTLLYDASILFLTENVR